MMKAELRAQKSKAKSSMANQKEEEDEELEVGEEDLAFFDEHEDFASGFLGSIQSESALKMVGKRHETTQERRERKVRPRVEETGPSTSTGTTTTTRPPTTTQLQAHRRDEDESDMTRKASTKGWEAGPTKNTVSMMMIGMESVSIAVVIAECSCIIIMTPYRGDYLSRPSMAKCFTLMKMMVGGRTTPRIG